MKEYKDRISTLILDNQHQIAEALYKRSPELISFAKRFFVPRTHIMRALREKIQSFSEFVRNDNYRERLELINREYMKTPVEFETKFQKSSYDFISTVKLFLNKQLQPEKKSEKLIYDEVIDSLGQDYKVLIDKIAECAPYMWEEMRSDTPRILQIETTNHCMMNCITCPRGRGKMTRKLGHMDFELFKRIIDQTNREISPHVLLHHFGDPFLHPQIEKFVDYVQKKGIRPQFSTNAVSATAEKVSPLFNLNNDVPLDLMISLQGTDDETYKYCAGKNADYNLAIKNIENIFRIKKRKNANVIVVLQMLATKGTDEICRRFRKFWESKGVLVWTKAVTTYAGTVPQEIIGTPLLVKCEFPFDSLTILWDGKVVPCCVDYNGEIILGDTTKESLAEIWNGELYQNLRKQYCEGTFKKEEHLCTKCEWAYFNYRKISPSKGYPICYYRAPQFSTVKL